MENEKLIKHITTVFTAIVKKMVNPSYKFPKGGATIRTLTTFIALMEREFGSVTNERLVDACITGIYPLRERKQWKLNQIFGTQTIKRIKGLTKGHLYYQNKWLESANISRNDLINLIQDRSKHPLAKFIYVHSEETTKKRHLNQNAGYLICQLSTLGWAPLSDSCQQCVFTDDCKKETQRKYPEIYRLRIENGDSTK